MFHVKRKKYKKKRMEKNLRSLILKEFEIGTKEL